MTQQLSLFPTLPADPPTRDKPPSRQVSLRQAVEAYLPTVSDLPPAERPRARLEAYGSGALATAELLAVLLGTPHQLHDAERLLGEFQGLSGTPALRAGASVAQANWTKLCDQDGIGPAICARIKASLELGRRLLVAAPSDKPQVRSPADAVFFMTYTESIPSV